MKISVVIPNYNRKEKLVLAIESVLQQSYKCQEVIVADDGSTDGSKELVLREFPEVVWINCMHTGLPAIVRNIGIKKAKNDWIAFLDNDDIWYKNKIEEQVKIIEKENFVAVCTNADRIIGGQKIGRLIKRKSKNLNFADLLSGNQIVCSSVLIKKDTLENAGCFPEGNEFKAFEDYALWAKITLNNNIYFISKNLVAYSDNPDQSIRKESIGHFNQRKILFDNLQKYVNSEPVNKQYLRNIQISIERAKDLFRRLWIK